MAPNSNNQNPAAVTPFVIDPSGKEPWYPEGRWRRGGRVTFSRPPEDCNDLLTWIDYLQYGGIYGLNRPEPDLCDEEFRHAVYDTWDLLHVVATRWEWKDTLPRPEPDREVGDALGNVQSCYSLAFVNRHLNKLREYCLAKAEPAPAAAAPAPPAATAPPVGQAGPVSTLTDDEFDQLTPKERKVLQIIGTQALRQDAIGAKLGTYIATGSVKGHLQTLKKRGFIANQRPKGYFLTEKGLAALQRADRTPPQ